LAVIGILAIALAASVPGQDDSNGFNMETAVDLCASDAPLFQVDSRDGTTATYAIRLSSDAQSEATTFLRDLDPTRFRPGLNLQLDQLSLVFVDTLMPAHTVDQVRAELGVLCALADKTTIKLALFKSHDRRDRADIALREKRRAEAAERTAAEAREEHERQMQILPDLEELDRAVRDNWGSGAFKSDHDKGDTPVSVLDARCVGAGQVYQCKLDITELVKGTPQHSQFEASFYRDEDFTLQLWTPDIGVVD